MNKSDWERHADDVALARYSVISPLICRQLTAEERLATKAEVLAAVHLFPDGKQRNVSRRTLERLCSWYEGGHTTEDGEVVTEPGIEALRPLPRFDKASPGCWPTTWSRRPSPCGVRTPPALPAP